MSEAGTAAPTGGLRAWLAPPARLRRVLFAVGTQVLAFVLSMAVLIGVLAALHYDPGTILRSLWDGAAGSSFNIGISVSEAVPLVLAGTAVWLAFQGGLFNIGADGQLQIGGLAALVTVSEAGLPHSTFLLVPLGLVAATLAGAAWAGVAALLKSFRGANEIISTLMLNYVAFITVDQIMRGPLQSPENRFTPQTDPIPDAAVIQPFAAGTQLTWGIIVAVVVSVGVLAFVTRTTTGLRLRAIGLNREAARHAGVPVERYWLASFSLSGALCGLAGGLVILGLRYLIAPGWASPWGFQGILIAFLALGSPLLIPVWGILFGMLASAGPVLKGDASVPDSIVTIMQTLPVIVLFLLYAGVRLARGGYSWRALLPRASETG